MTGSFEQSVEFGMQELFDDPDAVRLVVSGELDLAVAAMLGDRLRQLGREGHAVRLDLAELGFIDSSGLRELIIVLSQARSDGRRLDIDPQITEPVQRTIEVAGLHSHFWPESG